MRRENKFLIALCLAVLVSMVSAAAYSDDTFDELTLEHPGKGFITVLTDTEGDVHSLDGVLDVEAAEWQPYVEGIASYQIVYDGEVLLETVLHDVRSQANAFLAEPTRLNGYYAVTFTVSEEDHTKAFLTGLTPVNVEQVQTELVNARLENSEFTMEHLDFIDAEKTNRPNDGDNELCWTASTSCILHYTGWGREADEAFQTADDLLDLFVENFTDLPGNTLFGLDWFFNGVNQPQQGMDGSPSWGIGWPQVKNYGESGCYLPQYYVGSVVNWIGVSMHPGNMAEAMDLLRNGWGLGISLGWVDENGARNGGHAITAWGYLYDEDYQPGEKEYYTALVISDSDSDQQMDEDRRAAPNKLRVLNMEPFQLGNYDSWQFTGYGGVLEEFFCLRPCDGSVPVEEGGKQDRFDNYEFYVADAYASNDPQDETVHMDYFKVGDTIYVTPEIYNDSYRYTSGNGKQTLSCAIAVTPKGGGEPLYSNTTAYSAEVPCFDDLSLDEAFAVTGLEPGDYTVTVTVNPDHGVDEAYYSNNSDSFDITVEESGELPEVAFSAELTGIGYDHLEDFGVASGSYTFTCDGLDAFVTALGVDASVKLYAAYYEDEEWGAWKKLDDGSVTAGYTGPVRGGAVRFRLTVYGEDTPVYHFYSGELPLSYIRHVLRKDAGNTDTYTPLDRGAAALADGEKFAFRVEDISTAAEVPESILCKVALYAAPESGEHIILQEQEMTLTGGNSDVIEITSWDADLSGVYSVYAVLESDYCRDELELGELAVREALSTVVTTWQDTENDYDGLISLREAVAYLKEFDGEKPFITFADDVSVIYLSAPVTIDEDVTLQGHQTILYGNLGTNLIQIAGDVCLTGDGMIFHSAYSSENGAAILNNGGTVVLSRSNILYNYADGAGGAICSDGGKVVLKNCNLKQNISEGGSTIVLINGAELDMLNCSVFGNQPSAVLSVDGTSSAEILYTTFTDNGGAVDVADGGRADLFGCIVVQCGETPFSGNVTVHGCFTGAAADVFADLDAESGEVLWEAVQQEYQVSYQTAVTPLVNQGIAVNEEGGNIAWSADGIDWTVTDIVSAFTGADYATDILGQPHGRLYGSIAYVAPAPDPDPAPDPAPSHSSGGSNSTSVTVRNPDGSTTTTTTDKKSGTVTETTRTPDGVTGTMVTDKDGTVTKLAANVPASVAREAAKNGSTVTLPVTVPAVTDSADTLAVTITAPTSVGEIRVELPVAAVTPGTVAVLVNADGTETVVKTSVPTENGVVLTICGNTTVKLVDNSKAFDDVPSDSWAAGAVAFVTARELFNGKTEAAFVPNESTTRAQLITILARLDGADTSGSPLKKGMDWAVERGISDGSAPGSAISRQQLAVMLWRYAGSPDSGHSLDSFSDADQIGGYARKALAWANENGIVNGYPGAVLKPTGQATRAQVAQMLKNYIENWIK